MGAQLRRYYEELKRSRALRWIYPDVAEPTKFTRDFADDLGSMDEDVAAEFLGEAQKLFEIPFDRAEAAERRATTLQGAVAIAATFTLAAGTLVTSTDKIASHTWRIVFAGAIAVVVLAFVTAGVAALQATSRINHWQYPDDEERFARMAQLSVRDARAARATALLRAYGMNLELARWKIHRTTLAARWFRRALLLLVGFSVLFVAYVVWAGDPASPESLQAAGWPSTPGSST